MAQIVQVKYPQPLVRFNLMGGNGPDPYDGLDRFGRLKTALWEYQVSSLAVPREHIRYAYDQAGNRTRRDNRLAWIHEACNLGFLTSINTQTLRIA
jgi:hypothetical protein